MKPKALIFTLLAAAIMFAAVYYLARVQQNLDDSPKPTIQLAPASAAVPTPAPPPVPAAPAPLTANDPRLDVLEPSLDNGLIEFVKGPNGKVVREIDQDPNSPGFKKLLREYSYAGDKVVGMIERQYLGNQVRVTRYSVTYKADGSVDRFQESTTFE